MNYYRLPRQLRDECKEIGMDSYEIDTYETYWLKKQYVARTGKKSKIDSEKTKVYESEWAFQKKVKIKKFKNINEAEKRMRQITNSKLWSSLEGKQIRLKHSSRMRAHEGYACYGGTIKLADSGLNEYTLIHELAHQTPNAMHHGVQFRINVVKLVSRFMGTGAAKELKSEFKDRKLKLSISKPQSPETWYKSYKRMEKLRERIT